MSVVNVVDLVKQELLDLRAREEKGVPQALPVPLDPRERLENVADREKLADVVRADLEENLGNLVSLDPLDHWDQPDPVERGDRVVNGENLVWQAGQENQDAMDETVGNKNAQGKWLNKQN